MSLKIARSRSIDVLVQALLELAQLIDLHVVEQALRAGVDDQNLLGERQRLVLSLLQDFRQALAAGQLLLRGFIEIAAELRERRQFAILRQIESQTFRQPVAWP